jgi:hypothetical protein
MDSEMHFDTAHLSGEGIDRPQLTVETKRVGFFAWAVARHYTQGIPTDHRTRGSAQGGSARAFVVPTGRHINSQEEPLTTKRLFAL